MIVIFDPPERIDPEDQGKIRVAATLSYIFVDAANAEANRQGLKIEVFEQMQAQDIAKIHSIFLKVDKMTFETEEKLIAGRALTMYLDDIFLAAAVGVMSRDVIIQTFPNEYATEDMADLFERYDMFTTASLIRHVMP